MLRSAFLSFCALGLIGCGEDGVLLGGQSGEPLEIILPGYSPGSCWSNPPEIIDPTTADTVSRSTDEFNLSFGIQLGLMLGRPIADDPGAGSWRVEFAKGSVIEGTVLARGEDWGVVKMVGLLSVYDGRERTINADIDIVPGRTLYDFGDETLIATNFLVAYGDRIRGCEPAQEASFERLGGVSRCWRNDEVGSSGQGLSGGAGAAPGGSYGTDGVLSIPGRRPRLVLNEATCNQMIDDALRW
jgi:hypothetical protein